ncbi:MAG: hypothetical protein V1719_01825 [Patescibacteria group bacterium]
MNDDMRMPGSDDDEMEEKTIPVVDNPTDDEDDDEDNDEDDEKAETSDSDDDKPDSDEF